MPKTSADPKLDSAYLSPAVYGLGFRIEGTIHITWNVPPYANITVPNRHCNRGHKFFNQELLVYSKGEHPNIYLTCLENFT